MSANHPPLFCKPAYAEASADKPPFDKLRVTDSLFSQEFPELPGTISFRALNLRNDLTMIHEWVQKDYSLEYWQMNGHFSQLFAIYQCMELNPYSASFIGFLDDKVVCQFDVYSVFADELRDHVLSVPYDCGFHLLMAPNEKPISGLTVYVVKAFLNYYFSFTQAQRMYAEPDVNNEKSIRLLERVGFKWVKTVEMSYKRAHVYCLERSLASARDDKNVSPSYAEGDE